MSPTDAETANKVASIDARWRGELVCPTHGIPDCSEERNGCTVPAYLRRAQQDVQYLDGEIARLNRVLGVVTSIKDRLLDGLDATSALRDQITELQEARELDQRIIAQRAAENVALLRENAELRDVGGGS